MQLLVNRTSDAALIRLDPFPNACKDTTLSSYFCEASMPKFTIEERLDQSLKRSKANVFLRKDFEKLGGYDQVGRALREATKKGKLVKAGYGVYVRARESSLSGKPVPVIGLVEVGLLALEKLGVKADVGSSARAYRDGVTTQMPMAAVVSVGKARVSRRIGFGNKTIRYEKN